MTGLLMTVTLATVLLMTARIAHDYISHDSIVINNTVTYCLWAILFMTCITYGCIKLRYYCDINYFQVRIHYLRSDNELFADHFVSTLKLSK